MMGFNAQYGNHNAAYGTIGLASRGGTAYAATFSESAASGDAVAAAAHAAIAYGENVTAADGYPSLDQSATPPLRIFSAGRENRSF